MDKKSGIMNKTRSTSIRVKENIMQIADELKEERGYSRADLFEMGVLLMDNANQTEQVTQERILDEMIKRFEALDKKITRFHEELLLEIEELKNKKSGKNTDYNYYDLESAVDSIINVIERREVGALYGKEIAPLGKEFFRTKYLQYHVPVDVIIEELEQKGYTKEYLENIGIYPYGRMMDAKTSEKNSMEI